MTKSFKLWLGAGIAAACIPMSAMAQTITINATVNSQCNIGNATVTLGALNLNVQTNNTGTNIQLTCNRGATVSVALNDGLNFSASKRLRRAATTDYLNYNVTVPTIAGTTTSCPGALPGTEWNATNTLVATSMYAATGGQRDLALCVSVPSGQFNIGAGTYTDTVTATLTVT